MESLGNDELVYIFENVGKHRFLLVGISQSTFWECLHLGFRNVYTSGTLSNRDATTAMSWEAGVESLSCVETMIGALTSHPLLGLPGRTIRWEGMAGKAAARVSSTSFESPSSRSRLGTDWICCSFQWPSQYPAMDPIQ